VVAAISLYISFIWLECWAALPVFYLEEEGTICFCAFPVERKTRPGKKKPNQITGLETQHGAPSGWGEAAGSRGGEAI